MGGGGSKTATAVVSTASGSVKRSLPKARGAVPAVNAPLSSSPQAAAAAAKPNPNPNAYPPHLVATDNPQRHSFFQRATPNDGSLAPVVAPLVDAAALMAVKDTVLVQRMNQLAGSITMTRLEISGHKRATELAEARRKVAETMSFIKMRDASTLFHRAAAAAAEAEEPAAKAATIGGATVSAADRALDVGGNGGGRPGSGDASDGGGVAPRGPGGTLDVVEIAALSRRFGVEQEVLRGLLRYYQHAEQEEMADASVLRGFKIIKRWRD